MAKAGFRIGVTSLTLAVTATVLLNGNAVLVSCTGWSGWEVFVRCPHAELPPAVRVKNIYRNGKRRQQNRCE
jgi:hypothetical protein